MLKESGRKKQNVKKATFRENCKNVSRIKGKGRTCLIFESKAPGTQQMANNFFSFYYLRVHLLKLGTVKQGRAQDRGRNRKEARWGCFASLRNNSHSERNEPRRGCCQLTGQSEKRGPWRQVQGVSCHCPLLPWLQVLWGPLEFRRCMPAGEGEEEGKGIGVLREGEHAQ